MEKDISIIIPVMNEEENIDRLLASLDGVMVASGVSYEYLFIEGGSKDSTLAMLEQKAKENDKIKIITLSKSFGKEASMLCGFDYAAGRAVIPVDADLQDPPELIPQFIAKWREGYQMVYGKRRHRDESFFKRFTSKMFYKVYNFLSDIKIPQDAGDFRLLDRRVVDALKTCRERNMFMKGLFGWVGYKSCAVEYDRPPRAAGETSWSYWKLWNFALDGILNSSTLPLRIWTYVGILTAVISGCYALYIVTKTLVLGTDVPGYASLLVFILFFGAVQMVSVGILGEYISRIYKEVKQRPNYIIERKNF